MNNKINLMLIMNNRFAKISFPMLLSLIQNIKQHISFFVFTDDLSVANRQQLNLFLSKNNCTVSFIDIDSKIFSGFLASEQFPLLLYCKIAPHLFLPPNIKRILYLDLDVIVRGDLSKLYNTDIDDFYICACYGWRAFRSKFFENDTNKTSDEDAFNSGVVLYNLDLMRRDISIASYYNWLSNYIKFENKSQTQYEEWLMLNLMRGKIKYMMPFDYNYNINSHATQLYSTYCAQTNIKPLCLVIHYLPLYFSNIEKPWYYYDVFVKNGKCELPKNIEVLYRIWWTYAMKLPQKILGEYAKLKRDGDV